MSGESGDLLDAAIEEICNRLFTNGVGEDAKRLVLELENGGYGGGWSRVAVRDQIRDVLKPETAPNDNETSICKICGQTDFGQTGEYPCPACGLPTLHDELV